MDGTGLYKRSHRLSTERYKLSVLMEEVNNKYLNGI